MTRGRKVFVAGHRGLVGSALIRRLSRDQDVMLVTRSRAELDLRDQVAVRKFFDREKPAEVYLAAARVGGIMANASAPADFIRDNLLIQSNVIDAAFHAGVRRLLFLGSSCAYPREALQPMSERVLLSGPLEPTNQPYAIAKIAGIEMCDAYRRQYGVDFRSVMPTNLYGPNDNFDLTTSHVVPALIRRFHEAKRTGAPVVTVWGSGLPRREILHVDDMADACVFVLEAANLPALVNIGWGRDITIAALAELIRDVTGYQGAIEFDHTKPDGTPQKLLDTSVLSMAGWLPKIELRKGIELTYRWYLEHGAVQS